MARGWRAVCAALVCVLLLTGCDTAFLDPEAAIRAPAATGLYAGAQDALEAAVGSNIALKYPPVRGAHSAFFARDLNGDGSRELLAFYQKRTEGAVTRVHLLRATVEGGWQSVQDLEPLGGDVADVDVCDLDGDGTEEVCIGWSVYTARNKQMCVYQLVDGVLVQRAAEAYTRYVICDMDNDGQNELGLALLDTEKQTSSVSFFKMQDGALSGIGSLMLDGTVTAYARMTAASITAQTAGVYLDAYKGNAVTITELIYFKAGKLYNPFASSKTGSNIATLRYCVLTAGDVNADGVMEIPFSQVMPGYEEDDTDPAHHMICWRYFNGRISDTVNVWWYHPAGGCYLELDSNWAEQVTVTGNADEDGYTFYAYDGKTVGQPLFSLKTVSAARWEADPDPALSVLYENETTVWVARVWQDNAYGITAAQLADKFHLIIE